MPKFNIGEKVRIMPDGDIHIIENIREVTDVNGTIVDTLYKLSGSPSWTYEIALELVEDTNGGQEMHEIISHGNTIRPGYYQSAMGDVFDIADAYKLDMPLGTAAKYILRAGKKDKSKEIEDLEKAMECIRRAIELRRAKE